MVLPYPTPFLPPAWRNHAVSDDIVALLRPPLLLHDVWLLPACYGRLFPDTARCLELSCYQLIVLSSPAIGCVCLHACCFPGDEVKCGHSSPPVSWRAWRLSVDACIDLDHLSVTTYRQAPCMDTGSSSQRMRRMDWSERDPRQQQRESSHAKTRTGRSSRHTLLLRCTKTSRSLITSSTKLARLSR